MKFELKPDAHNASDEELLADLRKVFNESGGYFSMIVYDEDGKYGYAIFRKRFGSWDHSKIAAGIKQLKVDIVQDELLFQNLEDVCLKLGRQPKYDEVKAPLSKFSAAVYKSRFGTWMKALEKFVEFEKSIRSYLGQVRKVPLPFLITPTASEAPEELQLDGRYYFDAQVLKVPRPFLRASTVSEAPEELQVDESQQERLFESLKYVSDNPKRTTNRFPNDRLRWQVHKRDNFRCVSCGRSPAKDPNVELHVDHIIPWSKGGETVLGNLQTLCSKCNLGKSNME